MLRVYKQFAIPGVLITLLFAPAAWWLLVRQPAVTDPFDAKILAANSFPLYYPTKLPPHYHIDPKSVASPQPGVVVFSIKGPKGATIYISEEARPATFDFGGYYKNFTGLHEKVTDTGTIATGYINNGHTAIGSIATNKTWVLTNTQAKVVPGQLATLLNSLAASH